MSVKLVKQNWVSKIRDMLNVTGFNLIWLYPQSVVTNVFVPLLKQRLKDTFITEWRRGIETSSTMLMFKNLKAHFRNFTLPSYSFKCLTQTIYYSNTTIFT